jgi:ribosomal protein S18 acetylase RimI-like enzyme
MKTEFKKAFVPREIKSLMTFDQKVFAKSDLFDIDDWKNDDSYWMIVDGVKVGCCAFDKNVDFQDDIAGCNPDKKGSLYVSTTGILPGFQSKGFGKLMKAWEISYARYHGFTRIVTNHRKSNARMIKLNQKFGFKTIRTTRRYYDEPVESVVVMELLL